ncbi:MAG TPA: cation diffusion facilitator family transporter [Pirellulales bacterium]|jgi:cobalt-zinc-cadmium efflux system protein|nr:cation diffusion facilitator family transporter [Pirellulales bacterium]
MGHDHGHHHHRTSADKRRLKIVLVLSLGYMVAEIVGGYLADSLALLADAGHMLADVAALALSLAALWIAERPPTPHRTFGYYRAEILAALANGALLGAISIYIVVEAVGRLTHPHSVQGEVLFIVAFGGLLVNIASLAILHGGAQHSLNMRGAWLHVLADMLGSIGAIAAGLCVWFFDWNWADPVFSIVISLLIIYSGWGLVQESVSILMESAPKGIDVDLVRSAMMGVTGVESVHDLHIWTITSGLHALAAHVVMADGLSQTALLEQLRAVLHDGFGIDHITVQVEPTGFEQCATDSSCDV